jgi:hypothetical protein
MHGEHTNETDFSGESESESDVPILIPVPFTELSSIQYFPVEEQLLQLTAALKEQFGRHCFIKIHHRQTQPLRVPLVVSPYTTAKSIGWYKTKLLEKGGAVAALTVDEHMAKEHERWNTERPTTVSSEQSEPWADILGRE